MVCIKCKRNLPEEMFRIRKDRGTRGTKCIDCQREYGKNWNHQHPELCAQYSKKWRENNPEKKAECWKNWAENNPRKHKEWKNRNAKTESGKLIRARIRHKRRTIFKEVENTLTLQEWLEILQEQNNKCAICGVEFTDKIQPQKDHKIPLTENGPFTKKNIQALCKKCNIFKDATPEQRRKNKIKYSD